VCGICYAHEFNLNVFRHEWSFIQYSRRAIDYNIYFIDENKRYSRKFRWTMFSVFLRVRDEQNQHYHIQREVEFKFKKCFLFQMQQLSDDCVWMLINTQNRQKWSWTVHNWIQYIRVWGSNFVKFQNPLAQLRMMTNHYTKWLRVKRLRLVVHDQKLGKTNNGTKTKSLPIFVLKKGKF
jgi:hypothetical protein